MKRFFKRGLSLIITVLFLFSGFQDELKLIGNSFIANAEEDLISETKENTQSDMLEEESQTEENTEKTEENTEKTEETEVFSETEELPEETEVTENSEDSQQEEMSEEEEQLKEMEPVMVPNLMQSAAAPNADEGISLAADSDTYTYNGLTIKTNDGSSLTTATAAGATDIYTVSNVITINTSKPLTISGTTTTATLAVAAGVKADVTFNGVSITHSGASPVNILPKNAADQTVLHLTLADGTTNTLNATGASYAGLHVNYGGKLIIDDSVTNPVGVYGGRLTADCTINGEDLKAGAPAWKMDSKNPGSLKVTGGQNGADIGGNDGENSGQITINGGKITVNAYTNGSTNSAGAGIGGGNKGGAGCSLDGGGIIINGGIIDATASYHGAGIGAGWTANTAGVNSAGRVPGDITINGGYITSTGKDHGNAFGGACGSGSNIGHGASSTPHEITITGGTLLPKSNNNGTQWDVGANGGKVIVTGGSFFPAKNASSSTGYSIQGAQVVSSDGTSLTMVTIDLSSYTYKDAAGVDKSLAAGDYLYSYNVTVDGTPVSPEYGLSTKLDGTKKLYFWLPASSKGKSVSISNVILQAADGTIIDTNYPFTLPEVGNTTTGDVTKRYVTFEVDEEKFSPELKALINKRYDGLSFDWDLLNQEIVKQEIEVPQPVDGKITKVEELKESAVRLLDASGNTTGEGSSEDEFYQAGSYKITVNYNEYAKDTNFSKTFWGHQTTLNSVITPADTVIFDAEYDVSFYKDAEGKNQVETMVLNASVRPKDGEALTCAAPDGYIQFYINGVRVGDPVKVTPKTAARAKAKAFGLRSADGANGYQSSTASITLQFKDNQDYPKVPDLTAFNENVEEKFVVTAKYYDGTNYTKSEGRVTAVEEEEEPENFPFVNPPVAVVTPVDPNDVDPDEPIGGDPKKPTEIKIEEEGGKDILHSYVSDRLNAKVEAGKVREKDELIEMMNHRYGFTNPNNTVLIVDDKPVLIENIKIVDEDGTEVESIDLSDEGAYQITTTVKDAVGNKTTVTLNYGVKDIARDPDDEEKEIVPDVDTDGDGFPDINIDTDGDGDPDVNVDTDDDGTPEVNVDTDDDGKPDVNIDKDGDGKPDLNIVDKDGDGKPDPVDPKDPDPEKKKPDLNIVDKDGDGTPDDLDDLTKEELKDLEPDVNIDTDDDGKPDVNVDTDDDGKPDVNIDKDGDKKPDLNIVDKDGDGKPDPIDPKDPDQDKTPDLNIVDKDGDGKPDDLDDLTKEELEKTEPDVNIDTTGDGKPDVNVDTDDDGKPDVNIDKDGDKKPDLNIVDKDGDGKHDSIDPKDPNQDKTPNVNIVDKDGDGKPDDLDDLSKEELGKTEPDVNVDTTGDGKPNLNVDTDGDGKPDVNIDTDGDGKADKNIDADGDGKVDVTVTTVPAVNTGDNTNTAVCLFAAILSALMGIILMIAKKNRIKNI